MLKAQIHGEIHRCGSSKDVDKESKRGRQKGEGLKRARHAHSGALLKWGGIQWWLTFLSARRRLSGQE